jgi:protocatechuate 3,4-dioxygenase beta subunit
MRLPTCLLSVILLLSQRGQPPAFQAQTPQQQQSSKASIEGVVTSASNNEPLERAQLSLIRMVTTPPPTGASPPPQILPVMTDSQGKFAFKDIDAGTYRIAAARNGYARQEYGQRAAVGNGTPINLVAGQEMKDLVFRMTPAGTLNGHIRNGLGEPVTGVQVQLLRPIYSSLGQRTFQTTGSARTDDRGEYRLYWVTPGRYYLLAGSSTSSSISLLSALGGISSPNEIAERAYPSTYYPGTLDITRASEIEVPPAGDLGGVDVVLLEQQLHRIRGRVIDAATGQPPKAANVSINLRQPVASSVVLSGTASTPYNAATGAFELRDVPPGQYWLRGTQPTDLNTPVTVAAGTTIRSVNDLLNAAIGNQNTAQMAVDVSDSDVDGLVLTMSPGISIPGRVTIDGADLSSIAGSENIRLQLRGTSSSFAQRQPLAADGTLSLDNVSPGEYRVMANLPQQLDLYIKSVRIEQTDALNQPWVIGNSVSGTLNVVLGRNTGQIEGTAVDARRQPAAGVQVVLIPDRSRDRYELFRAATTDQNGHFTMRAIAPAEYKIFAWEALEPYAYFDPELLRRFESQGRPVKILESSRENMEVKAIPAVQ